MESLRYLITGGAGFIGSHLAERLIDEGHFVTVIDDLSTGSWSNVAALERNRRFRAIISDAADERLIGEEVPKSQYIFHLASAVGVQLIVDRPVDSVQRIIRATDTVVAAAAKFRTPILLTSTSEVYGKSSAIPFREDADVVLGATQKCRWAYAAAKMVDEFLMLAHFRETSLPVVIARLFNTVGRRQSPHYGMVLPRFVDAAVAGRSLRVFGDGQQTRCFCSVNDVTSGLVALSRTPNAVGQVVNIGSDEEVTINDLACRVIALASSTSAIELVPYHAAYSSDIDDTPRRVPDLTRARKLINWQPQQRLDDIIRDVLKHKSEHEA
ncbi:MAG: GDP-mannose 4,6-dehydratase [Thermoguttaceae bacterium]